METVATSDAIKNETGTFESLIPETSEEVSCQLHYLITKAARRVVLDEIISNVIAEFVNEKKVNEKKALRPPKLELINHIPKDNSSDGATVSFTILVFHINLLIFFDL